MLNSYWGKASSEINQPLQYLSIWEHSLNVSTVAKVWLENKPLILD
ncbi:MAG: hypothetical protein ACI86H_002573, partial [bacterium]